MASHRIAIGLGSNLGDRGANLRQAVRLLEIAGLTDVVVSSFHATAAVQCGPDAPEFLNAALVAATPQSPVQLLESCLAVEAELGRQSDHPHGPPYSNRLIDIDLLLVDDLILETGQPILPHPRLTDRRFVLAPLAEIAPDWVIPTTGQTVQQHLSRLNGKTAVGPA